MSLSDPIGDMIARVKNAQARFHKKVDLPSSNFKSKIADILKNEGFIKDFKVSTSEKKNILSLELKYHSGNPVINNFERVSKPGRRIFSSADSLPKSYERFRFSDIINSKRCNDRHWCKKAKSWWWNNL